MKELTVGTYKIRNLWYVIVKDEKGENVTTASFTTKKVADHARDAWAERYGYTVVK